jgi:hypothetical protein
MCDTCPDPPGRYRLPAHASIGRAPQTPEPGNRRPDGDPSVGRVEQIEHTQPTPYGVLHGGGTGLVPRHASVRALDESIVHCQCEGAGGRESDEVFELPGAGAPRTPVSPPRA